MVNSLTVASGISFHGRIYNVCLSNSYLYGYAHAIKICKQIKMGYSVHQNRKLHRYLKKYFVNDSFACFIPWVHQTALLMLKPSVNMYETNKTERGQFNHYMTIPKFFKKL
jgi:hypothetical protein